MNVKAIIQSPFFQFAPLVLVIFLGLIGMLRASEIQRGWLLLALIAFAVATLVLGSIMVIFVWVLSKKTQINRYILTAICLALQITLTFIILRQI